jgi:protein-tyrosine phosphatase
MDLRSDEELDLYPNTWAQSAGIRYLHRSYSIVDLFKQSAKSSGSKDQKLVGGYASILEQLTPQLSQYFAALLNGHVPIVVNCSAGQDRTGAASALSLSILGVERTLIIEDYLLSTDLRQPANEVSDVDLAEHARNNAFADIMLMHGQGQPEASANSLLADNGVSLIELTLDAIDRQYGSVANYLALVLGVDEQAQAQLRQMYLQQ